MTIVISWKGSNGEHWPEYLDIDPDHLDKASINQLEETKQWSPYDERFVYWGVDCSLEDGQEDHCEIMVRYTESKQHDENIRKYIDQGKTEYFFGENRIIVKRNSETDQARWKGVCKWKGKDPAECAEVRWKAIGRPRLTVKRIQFQRESSFRENVLAVDTRCVISGEETPEVLDAAHLRPVKEGGEECVENGFILRTDIHRLYDRGMFLINPEDGKLVVDDRNLSKYYRQLLCSSGLPPATLERVRKALEERWKKPQP